MDIFEQLPEPQLLALLGIGEARGEPVDGQIAVMRVVGHRVRDKRWPDTWRGVILQPLQFSAFNVGDPNRAKLMELAALFLADVAIRSATKPDPILRQCLFLAEGIIGGQLLDNVAGANHYCTRALYERQPPSWTVGETPVARIGGHVFFKL